MSNPFVINEIGAKMKIEVAVPTYIFNMSLFTERNSDNDHCFRVFFNDLCIVFKLIIPNCIGRGGGQLRIFCKKSAFSQ